MNLHETVNPGCKKCPAQERTRCAEDGLRQIVCSVIDAGPVRCVGEWAKQKRYFLTQYFGIFGQGMKNRWQGKLHYIEICSGPGRCILRENGMETVCTFLAVLEHQAFSVFAGATFIDYDEKAVSSLTNASPASVLAKRQLQSKLTTSSPGK